MLRMNMLKSLLIIGQIIFCACETSRYECAEGWVKYQEECWLSSIQTKSWIEAGQYCQKNGPDGKLIEIYTAEINTAVSELVNGTNFEYWIGLKDLPQQYYHGRKIGWNSTGQKVEHGFMNFQNRIDNYVTDRHCGFLDDRGLWYLTKSCNLKKRFLCQKKTDCSYGYYGPICTLRCHCYKADCDRKTGKCPYGCSRGWMGETCNKKKSEADVAVYCMDEKNNRHVLLRIDLKGVRYDQIYLLDDIGAIACNKSLFTPDGDGIYNLDIITYFNGTTKPHCSPKHTSEDLFEWTLRTEEVEGLLSDYDRKFHVKCNFNKAEKLFRQKNQPVSQTSTVNLIEKEIKQTTETVKLIVQDPSSKESISKINIGSKIQLAMVLDTHNTNVSAKGIFPYNCSCSTSDGKITRYLTDSSGCPLKNSPIVSIEEAGSYSHLVSNAFDAFTIEGRSDVIFHCQFRFCFDASNLSECRRMCDGEEGVA